MDVLKAGQAEKGTVNFSGGMHECVDVSSVMMPRDQAYPSDACKGLQTYLDLDSRQR